MRADIHWDFDLDIHGPLVFAYGWMWTLSIELWIEHGLNLGCILTCLERLGGQKTVMYVMRFSRLLKKFKGDNMELFL